jgi:putative toxin-antitoxin system antitoxin component (TIGR02293 family)
MNLVATMESLGGAAVMGREAHSEVEAVEMVEGGLPAATVSWLQRLGDLGETDLATIIPRRTLTHLKKSSRLSAEQSDRITRAAGIYQMAHEAFGNREKANVWMRQPNRALQGKVPLALLRTGSGARLVEDVLTRIAYGVYP